VVAYRQRRGTSDDALSGGALRAERRPRDETARDLGAKAKERDLSQTAARVLARRGKVPATRWLALWFYVVELYLCDSLCFFVILCVLPADGGCGADERTVGLLDG
jgi:hypothetical protein